MPKRGRPFPRMEHTMVYQRSLALEAQRVLSGLDTALTKLAPGTPECDRELMLESIVQVRKLLEVVEGRIRATQAQWARRNYSPTGPLPAPRSNHEGA